MLGNHDALVALPALPSHYDRVIAAEHDPDPSWISDPFIGLNAANERLPYRVYVTCWVATFTVIATLGVALRPLHVSQPSGGIEPFCKQEYPEGLRPTPGPLTVVEVTLVAASHPESPVTL